MLTATPAAAAVGALFAGPMSEPEFVTRSADPLGVALVLAMTLPVAWLRRRPRAMIAIAGAAALIASLAGYGFLLGALFVWVLVGVAALLTDRRTSVMLAIAAAVSVACSVAAFSPDNRDAAALLLAATVGALPAFVGDAQRRQRELTAEVLHLQQAELERAVNAERVRIARDVHDSVGHHLSAISLQAQAGQLEDAPGALTAIAHLSARAIDDTRQTLGVLRGTTTAPRTMPPRLERLDELVQTARLASVDVDVSLDGPFDDLPDLISACAYRVIQESLTNTARHGAPARARVIVRRANGRLNLDIADNGRTRAPRRDGLGLAGMRERVESLGGSLTYGPGRHGWHVNAELPDKSCPPPS